MTSKLLINNILYKLIIG